MFYNTYYILKDEINIIRSYFGEYRSYGSRFWSGCLRHNTYTVHIRGERDNVSLFKYLYWKMTKKSLQKRFLKCYSPYIVCKNY